jgi:hypothetical protein
METRGDVITGEVGAHASNVTIGKDIRADVHAVKQTNTAGGATTQTGGDYFGGTEPLEEVAELAEQSEFSVFEEQRNYIEVRQQAQQATLLAQIASEAGFLLVAGAVVLYMLGNTSAAVVSGVLSALSQAFAAFFARQVESSNERLERYHLRLLEAQRYDAAVRLVREMEEGPAKERAVTILVGRLVTGSVQDQE